jgi:hypothetical protein
MLALGAPEILKAIGRKLGIPDGVLDVLVPEPCLQRTGVVARVRQGVATAVAQHVRMYRELHLGPSPDPTE